MLRASVGDRLFAPSVGSCRNMARKNGGNLTKDINGLECLSPAGFEASRGLAHQSLNPDKSACFSQSQFNGTSKAL
jgi:hypothetical protein